jgi:hypothetical protein
MDEDSVDGSGTPARRFVPILGRERAGVQARFLPSRHALAMRARFVK